MTLKSSSCSGAKDLKGSLLFQYLAMITSTLAIICSGMHYGWPSPSLPKLLTHGGAKILITDDEGSWMAVMPLVGGICGSILGGLIMDIVGRKKVLILSLFPFFASWLLIAYAESVAILQLARLVAGISDGLSFCAVPIYLGEIAEPKIRGFLGASVSVTWIFGTLLINILGAYLSISMTALISSSIPVLCLITFWWMPESPYYLMMKNQKEKARRSLMVFKGTEDVEMDLERICEAVKEQRRTSGNFLDLFKVKSNRKAFYVMLGTRGFQQFCGTGAITFYNQTIFQEAADVISPRITTIIYFTLQLIFCTCCSVLVDKVGRRPLLIISIAGAGIALLVEAVYSLLKEEIKINMDKFGFIPITAMIGFVIIFSIGMQTIPLLFLGELFPTNVKAFALSVADIYFNVIATTISKLFQYTKDTYGLYLPFFVFTMFSFIGLAFMVFVVPETKGRTLEEIQIELKGEEKQTRSINDSPEMFCKLEEL